MMTLELLCCYVSCVYSTFLCDFYSVPEHVQRQQHQAFLEAESIGSEDAMRRWRQEQFVMEISELVHSQLVSSTLNGEFRDRLERQMRVCHLLCY